MKKKYSIPRYSVSKKKPRIFVSEKKCKDCGLVKPAKEFHSHAQTLDRLGTYCKICHRLRIAAWSRKVGKDYWREWREAHPGYSRRYKANEDNKRPGIRAKRDKEYRLLKPWVWTSANARRRARKYQATPQWANKFFIQEIYDLAQRRSKMLGFKWHVDHIVPLKSELVCGLHVENNLQVIPGVLNISKFNRSWPDMPNA